MIELALTLNGNLCVVNLSNLSNLLLRKYLCRLRLLHHLRLGFRLNLLCGSIFKLVSGFCRIFFIELLPLIFKVNRSGKLVNSLDVILIKLNKLVSESHSVSLK